MKTSARESLTTDVIFLVGGLGGIAAAILRLDTNIEYLPNDLRSQPWFDPLVSTILELTSLFFLAVGAIRLAQCLRDRRQ